MTEQQTQTIEHIIGTHERLEQLTSDMVQFLVDINEALIDVTGHPSDRANALLDRYFAITDAP